MRFNSRTPGGVRHYHGDLHNTFKPFQFTHPGRGATLKPTCGDCVGKVSIHAPREGCDYHVRRRYELHPCFNSRTPGGVRLYRRQDYEASKPVSIHAPREGCDVAAFATVVFCIYVSIHAPREGCDRLSEYIIGLQSVSIHAPREGCDSVVQSCVLWGG